jgi:hypothetical protein
MSVTHQGSGAQLTTIVVDRPSLLLRCGQRILADRLFEVVLIQLFRWIIEHSDELRLPAGLVPGLSDERLAPTLIAIHESPGQPWTLTTMARTTGMSRSSFAATFKATVGQPAVRLLVGDLVAVDTVPGSSGPWASAPGGNANRRSPRVAARAGTPEGSSLQALRRCCNTGRQAGKRCDTTDR